MSINSNTGDSNIKQAKLIRHQAVYSIALGVISIILPYIIVIIQGTGISHGSALLFLFSMLVALAGAIVGLIFGTKRLKFPRRKLAVVGIVLCAIGLIIVIWGLVGWLAAGGTVYL
jgi:ABC-type microcin C transport system permease subunit YejB